MLSVLGGPQLHECFPFSKNIKFVPLRKLPPKKAQFPTGSAEDVADQNPLLLHQTHSS